MFAALQKTSLFATEMSWLYFLLEKGQESDLSKTAHVRGSLLTTSMERSNIDFRYTL
jgi:hypothetical protein